MAKIELREKLAAVDLGAKELWDEMDDDQRKSLKQELFILNRYISNVKGQSRDKQEHFVLAVNEYFNKNWNVLQKQQAIEQLFGKFQFSRLNALFENLGRQGSQTLQVLDLMKASSDELAAVAGRELTAVTESASGKYRRALESLKASLADVGEQFLTINTALIQVIDKVVQFATNLPGPIKQVLGLLGGITAIAGPLIMITGVLANFFGYIMKGVFHMKAFFKGGEGWKYLTPEMLAAEKAGKLVEQSFYSDAKAAAVLKQALGNLIDEFSVLEAKAKAGALSVNPAVSTMAGNLVMAAGGGRVVNPQHPLAGPMGTRASSHMVPRSGMTEQERLAQTMFGMVPGSGMVNQKIGQNPQIYMNDALPNVPGLTTVGGVSTGIVSGEAARWHSMMATLAMQSKAEIETLKKQIVATGTVSKEFMMQFDDILPIVSKLTDNAARESALIVAELRAGKLTVEAAKAKIIALNLETERMITSAVGAQATAMGRTINPTMVPTLNQPVVDPSGKSNMRELFKKGRTRDFINRVAGALGVRTSGAGYNIETTVPRKMNAGGYVYTMNDGNIVPGPNVNADVASGQANVGAGIITVTAAYQANTGTAALAGQANVGAGLITVTSAYQANVGAGLITVTNGYQANAGAGLITKVAKAGDTMTGSLSTSGSLIGLNLTANNILTVNTNSIYEATAVTTSTTAQVVLDSFSTATYRSAKYLVQITSGSSYELLELTLIHDGTTVYLSQYGNIKTGATLGVFDATISAGTLSVLATPNNAITTFKTAVTLIPT